MYGCTMELKPGYKQSEVGVIPADWEVSNLAKIAKKITDGDHATPRRTHSGYYLLSARNVLNGRIDVSDVDYVGPDEYNRMRMRCSPSVGDVLISCSGTIGRIAVIPPEFDCVLVRSAALIQLVPEAAYGTFVQYWLQGERAQKQISASVNQGAQPNLFLNYIERLLCPLPPLSEQKAIAQALSDMDSLISGLDDLIAKKRDIKQATMQQLLTGKTRLPGFSGDWEEKRLGDVGKLLKGRGITKDQAQSGNIACIRYGELYTHHNEIIQTIRSWVSNEVASSAIRLETGDILFAGSGETKLEIGKCAAFTGDFEAYAGGDIVILRPRSCDSTFLGYYLNSCEIANQKASNGQGDAVVHISSGALSSIRCTFPPLPEQQAIATVLSDIDAELEALEQRRGKTRELKQAMMQELLTGRTRLV
jgi:type I restriction enzyme S subunit